MRDVLRRGGTLFFCGNGGSAADAQHLATEYVVRYMKNRRALPAIALTTDTSLITAAGNDFGFDEIFARQVEALVTARDLLIIHSTSGNSPNVLKAAEAAQRKGAKVLAFSSRDGGALRSHRRPLGHRSDGPHGSRAGDAPVHRARDLRDHGAEHP